MRSQKTQNSPRVPIAYNVARLLGMTAMDAPTVTRKQASGKLSRRWVPTSISTSMVVSTSLILGSSSREMRSPRSPTYFQGPQRQQRLASREFALLCRDLQTACDEGNVEKVEEIFSRGVDPSDRILKGKPPVYWAVVRGKLALVKILVEKYRCLPSPQYVTENGTTLFHAACSRGHVEVARYLTSTQLLETTTLRKDGTSPIMAACFYGHLDVVKYLIEELRCDTQLPVSCADGSLLHIACSNNQTDVARYLVSEKKFDPNTRRSFGETPMHVACSQGHLSVVKYLTEELCCSLEVRDEAGDTLLHVSALNDHQEVVRYLIERGCKVDAMNGRGHTPLMSACRFGKCDTVKLLLELGKADPNCQNHDNESALQCTRDKVIIKELVRHGANTTNFLSSVLECHQRHSPLEALVRMFVVGHPRAGKSTLVKALQEIIGGVHIFNKKKVTGIAPLTAGIVPIEFESPDLGRVLLFDFAGQNEYYASHAALLEASKTSAPLFILVVNLLEQEREITFRINYWLSFINNHHVPGASITHIAVIASHKDKLHKEFPLTYRKKIATVESIVQSAVDEYKLLHMVGFFAVDCRKPHKHVKLRSKLRESCRALRSNLEIDGCCHVLSAFLCEKFEGKTTCTIKSVIKEIKESDLALPCTSERMCELVEALSERQNILFLRNDTCLDHSWIVLEVDTLLTKINGCIFAPSNFKEHRFQHSSSGTGVLAWTHLQRTFKDLNLNPELVVAFLRKLEFCEEVFDADILTLIQQGTAQERCRSPSYMDIERDCVSRSITTPGRYYVKRTRSDGTNSFEQDTPPSFSVPVENSTPPTSPQSPTASVQTYHTKQRITSVTSTDCLLQPPLSNQHMSQSNPDFERTVTHVALDGRLTQSCDQLVQECETRFFFFPGLLSHERPSHGKVWGTDDSFQFHTGWCMQVSHVNQFFTPRLLHILLLRISFGFAIAKRCAGGNEATSTRQCTIWKNGIRWLDLDGIETVVEMVEQSQAVVMLMRGKMCSELKCVCLRSKLVSLVLDVKRKFCPNLKVTQYLFNPKDLVNRPYPFASHTLDSLTLYEMSTVVTSIVEMKKWVCDVKGDSLCNLTNLLYFEPFTNLGEELLAKMFDDMSEEVTDIQLYDFLHDYSQAHYTHTLILSAILNTRRSSFSSVSSTTMSIPLCSSLNGSLNAFGSYPCFCTCQQGTVSPQEGIYACKVVYDPLPQYISITVAFPIATAL